MKRALCIGINNYGGENNLYGCVNDAMDWTAVLQKRGYTVRTLVDSGATGAGIRSALSQLMFETLRNDRVVITYSGHGSYVPDVHGDEPDKQDECWCASDIMRNEEGYILDDEIKNILVKRMPGARVILVSDSCFSGTITRHFAKYSVVQQRRIRYLHPAVFLRGAALGRVQSRPLRAVSSQYPAVLLAGCQEDEYSYDAWYGDRANGAFTRTALDTLTEGVCYRKWFSAIRAKLPCHDYPQTPNLDAGFWQKLWKALA